MGESEEDNAKVSM